ncbi:MAG: aminopeptidase P family protein [Candidatus Spyradocola sp.]|jgi:Xaa-Pro aminopeptidase
MDNTRLTALRARMAERGIDAYIVPTADDHESEYVGEHYKARAFLTGFTGSAGICAVTQTDAALWTDGRYFIQAAREIAGSGFRLMKSGEPGVPTLQEYLEGVLPEGGCLSFDGTVVNEAMARGLGEALGKKQVRLRTDGDLVGEIWKERPARSAEPAFLLPESCTGRTAAEKLETFRAEMREEGVDAALLTALDEIAWLFNVRGNDIACTPYLLAFAAVESARALLFAQEGAISEEVRAALAAQGVEVVPYAEVYAYAASRKAGSAVWVDSAKANSALVARIPEGVRVLDKTFPIEHHKAVKNPVEIENLKRAHREDGVAFVRFLKWLQENVGAREIDECDAAEELTRLRAQSADFLEPSFATICAYNENAAMMHYSAKPGSAARLRPEGLLLVDSGGQYRCGTTDITRTMVLGPVPETWKRHYTAVLRGMIRLAQAKFLRGCRGLNLDILARGPIWDLDLDYKCGTGHGVAFVGGVHEPPNGFRWRIVPERRDSCELEPGMVTTDEPGIYIEGSHGIRIENNLLCCAGETNEYGEFLHFETLTLAPIDHAAVLPEEMTPQERAWLNAYHERVYAELAPALDAGERAFLAACTRAL